MAELKKRKTETKPDPANTVLDAKVAATGSEYPDDRFVNPWNAGLDVQFPNADGFSNDDKTLYSPTITPEGMGAMPIHEYSSFDSNWEHGVRGGIENKPRGPREGSRWIPRGGKR